MGFGRRCDGVSSSLQDEFRSLGDVTQDGARLRLFDFAQGHGALVLG